MWALVSPDGVAPSRIVGVSASVNLPLQHKVHKFFLAPADPGGPGKMAVKQLWWWSLLFYKGPHHKPQRLWCVVAWCIVTVIFLWKINSSSTKVLRVRATTHMS